MIDLDTISTKPPENISKSEGKNSLIKLRKELFELQNKFYADGRFGLLIIFGNFVARGIKEINGIIRYWKISCYSWQYSKRI